MQAGRLDRLVTLQHHQLGSQAADGSYPNATYVAYASVWARKREISARERFAAQQTQAELDTVFEIRFRTDVVATDRLVCDGRTYDIRPGREIGRREGLELLATAVVA